MTTKDDKAPVRADDDGPELAAIAEQVRPVVDAGKGRALAFEVVRALLMIFAVRDTGPLFAPSFSQWFERASFALNEWLCRALDVDTGRENERHPAERLTLLTIAGVADRMASQAMQWRPDERLPLERWIVHDIATALRRACGCSDVSWQWIDEEEAAVSHLEPERLKRLREIRAHFNLAQDTLLPLLIRDARRLCAAAKVDVAPIEAAIARHGGRPS